MNEEICQNLSIFKIVFDKLKKLFARFEVTYCQPRGGTKRPKTFHSKIFRGVETFPCKTKHFSWSVLTATDRDWSQTDQNLIITLDFISFWSSLAMCFPRWADIVAVRFRRSLIVYCSNLPRAADVLKSPRPNRTRTYGSTLLKMSENASYLTPGNVGQRLGWSGTDTGWA